MSKRLRLSCEFKSLTDRSAENKFRRLTKKKIPIQTIFNNIPIGQLDSTANTMAILIGVYNYDGSGGRDANHAIAAFKHNGKLYCFNAHGNRALPRDKQLFSEVAGHCGIGPRNTYIYNGPNLQANDPEGACVGYATNFLVEVGISVLSGTVPKELNRNTYNMRVLTVLTTRGAAFGGESITGPMNIIKNLKKPPSNEFVVTKNSKASPSSATVPTARGKRKARNISKTPTKPTIDKVIKDIYDTKTPRNRIRSIINNANLSNRSIQILIANARARRSEENVSRAKIVLNSVPIPMETN